MGVLEIILLVLLVLVLVGAFTPAGRSYGAVPFGGLGGLLLLILILVLIL